MLSISATIAVFRSPFLLVKSPRILSRISSRTASSSAWAHVLREDELASGQARRLEWYQQLVAEADTMWARGHSYREISDMHRRAALSLGIERDWAFVPQKLVECPACGEKVKPGVAICKHCKAVLDVEKAAKHGIAPQK